MPRTSTRDPPLEPISEPLYDTDFHAWTVEQARLLRGGDLGRADLANIVEEVQSRGSLRRTSAAKAAARPA